MQEGAAGREEPGEEGGIDWLKKGVVFCVFGVVFTNKGLFFGIVLRFLLYCKGKESNSRIIK